MRALPKFSLLSDLLEFLITTDNSAAMREEKFTVIESIAREFIDELHDQGLSEAVCDDLEKHAYSVNDGVRDNVLRNMHVLAGIR